MTIRGPERNVLSWYIPLPSYLFPSTIFLTENLNMHSAAAKVLTPPTPIYPRHPVLLDHQPHTFITTTPPHPVPYLALDMSSEAAES